MLLKLINSPLNQIQEQNRSKFEQIINTMIHGYQKYSIDREVFTPGFFDMWNADETNFSTIATELKGKLGKDLHLMGVSVDSCLQLASLEGISRVTIVSLTDELLWLQLPFYVKLFCEASSISEMEKQVRHYSDMDSVSFVDFMFKLNKNTPFNLNEQEQQLKTLYLKLKRSLLPVIYSFEYKDLLWITEDKLFNRVRNLILNGAIIPSKFDLLADTNEPRPKSKNLAADILFLSNITGSQAWNNNLNQINIAKRLSPYFKTNTWVIHTPLSISTAVVQDSNAFSQGKKVHH